MITSSGDYSFEIRLQGDYTSADSDSDGEVFDIANNFTFNAGTLGSMAGDAALNGTGAGEFIFGLEGGDTIHGAGGNDSLFGGHDADVVNGDAGTDSIMGGYADDTLTGGGDADTLDGGSGDDDFVFTSTADSTTTAQDVIADFKHGGDADQIDLSAIGTITGIGDLTIQYNGDQYTSISDGGTFEIYLLGHYELGTDIFAADFIFT